ncbi:MAG: thiamine pyrophosphate-dependent enzyme, partial [Phycisphaerales bacterium]|nr:thiamine pyrophosphate-dependent enzyme [Phycisphaerales bacterium]
RARTSNRPTFIEAITYRLGDHTTADDARRYRDDEELEMWKLRDPLIRMRNYLDARGLWDDTKHAALLEEAEAFVSEVVKKAEGIEPLPPTAMFDHMFKTMTPNLTTQANTMRTTSMGRHPETTADHAGT